MKCLRSLVLVLMIWLAASGCTSGRAVESDSTPTESVTRTATPDVYATSAQRTLLALEAQGTAGALIGTRAPGATPASARIDTPAGPFPTFRPSPTPTLTPTLTVTPTPLAEATVIPTQQNQVLIKAFSVTPDRIEPGGAFILSWAAEGESATLHKVDERGQLLSVEEVALSGSLPVRTETSVQNSISYALYVTSGELTESATVTVNVRCTGVWFFTPAPAEGCPAAEVVQTAAAAQRFEDGLMMWLADLERVYVLYDDIDQPAYQVFEDPWEPGLPDNDPSLNPPAGMFQPVRGFGMVWRGLGPGADPDVRGRVGWALAPEFGYEATLQCDSATKYLTCYLRGPDGEVYRLEPEGSGWVVEVPALTP